MLKWFKRNNKETEDIRQEYDPITDPMTLAVNRAFNTGKLVEWNQGDKLPDPGGPVKPVRE